MFIGGHCFNLVVDFDILLVSYIVLDPKASFCSFFIIKDIENLCIFVNSFSYWALIVNNPSRMNGQRCSF